MMVSQRLTSIAAIMAEAERYFPWRRRSAPGTGSTRKGLIVLPFLD